MGEISLELGGEGDPYQCPCCGNESHTVWGFIYEDGNAHAVYYAGWTIEHEDKGVTIAIGLGDWGEDTGPEDRYSIGLDVRANTSDVMFSVLEPEQSSFNDVEFIGRMMPRIEALAHPQLDHIFHVAEHIVADDPRVTTALEGATRASGTPRVH